MSKIKRYKSGKRIYTKWDKRTKEVRVFPKKQRETDIQQPLKLEITNPDIACEVANLFATGFNESEFFIDFFNQVGNKASLRSRIIMSPANIKKLHKAIYGTLQLYEKKR